MRFVCESLDDIALCFVNLRSAKTLFECANLILSELGAKTLPSAKGLGAVISAIKDAIASYLQDAKKQVIILALDEFDMIFYDKRNKPSDFMYKLVVLCEQLKKEKNYQICIVGISNNVVSEYDLDERVRSRIGNSEVYFPAYGYEEILEILRMCSKEAFNEMDDVILQHYAKLSSQDHGDARRAIDLLRVGAEIAGAKNQALSTKHVDMAYLKLQNDRIIQMMSRVTSQFKYVCRAIVYLSYIEELEFVHTSKIYDEYKVINSKELHLSYRRISEILNDIENTGMVESQKHSRGRHGYGKQYKLAFSPDLIGPAIDAKWWDGLLIMKKQMKKSVPGEKIRKDVRKIFRSMASGRVPNLTNTDGWDPPRSKDTMSSSLRDKDYKHSIV